MKYIIKILTFINSLIYLYIDQYLKLFKFKIKYELKKLIVINFKFLLLVLINKDYYYCLIKKFIFKLDITNDNNILII